LGLGETIFSLGFQARESAQPKFFKREKKFRIWCRSRALSTNNSPHADFLPATRVRMKITSTARHAREGDGQSRGNQST
jgi:hypothetical protein